MRPVTLFTGQWADLPLKQLLTHVKALGFDGVELACWGDHFDPILALENKEYIPELWNLLQSHGLTCVSISSHLIGQAICDRIDERHQSILPLEIWGDGEPEGVRQRAAERMKVTARAARKFFDAAPASLKPERVVVNGFTGSSIWHSLYAFPPLPVGYWEKGYEDFANRFLPILDVFEENDVYFALEAHPTEIAFDLVSAEKSVHAVKGHRRFGFNFDPSHFGYQGVDYVQFIYRFAERIFHAHMKDVWWNSGNGSVGVFGGHLPFGDRRRHWDFRSLGRGNIDFEKIIVALNDIGYQGPLSVEWEDGRMDRFHGAKESCEFVRRLQFTPSDAAFDSAFSKEVA